MGKTYTVSDIHGNYNALKEVLTLCNFNKEQDTLISLGDNIDRGSQSFEVIEELISIPKHIAIRGNHCDMFHKWLKTGKHNWNWGQGGIATLKSYCDHLDKIFTWDDSNNIITSLEPEYIPISHHQFFANQVDKYIDAENRFFVHGGFNRHISVHEQDSTVFHWDRDLFYLALSFEAMSKGGRFDGKFKNKDGFEEIFLGHTPTQCWGQDYPMRAANIILLDTGCGMKDGKLSIIDVNSKQIWQSNNT